MSNINNNNDAGKSNNQMPEPTIADLISLIGNIPNKSVFVEMQNRVLALAEDNKNRINGVEQQVASVSSTVAQNTDRISQLEYTIQSLQQDKLRNNVCISGVPLDDNTDINEAIVRIAATLQVALRAIDFTAYTAANNKLIIVSFNNYTHKQMLLNKIRAKKSLMVEEVFGAIQSNSQIYINVHLTKYFNNLYLMARLAIKQGKLTSATTSGGKIRVRKYEGDIPVIITDQKQLQTIIDMAADTSMEILNQSRQEGGGSRHSNRPSTSKAGTSTRSGSNKRNRHKRSPSVEKREDKLRKKGNTSSTGRTGR